MGGIAYVNIGDIVTLTGFLDLAKLLINSVLLRLNAKIMCFDVSKFYLATPIDRSEYVWIKLNNTPQDFIDIYNLIKWEFNGWFYFEIICGCYGLPQSRKLANNLLQKLLNNAD